MKNPALKERHDGETPYMTWQRDDWSWHVLKCWQAANDKPGARWFCRVVTPMSASGGDYGDVYVDSIVNEAGAELRSWDLDIWPDREAVMAFVGEPQPVTF